MFTIQQIHTAAQKVKSGSDFPQFIQDLKVIGVCSYDQFVLDGHTHYYGSDYLVADKAKYPVLEVADHSSEVMLKNAITIHQQGLTDYYTFCLEAAKAGVEKWQTNIVDMTVSNINRQGDIILIEPIPTPER